MTPPVLTSSSLSMVSLKLVSGENFTLPRVRYCLRLLNLLRPEPAMAKFSMSSLLLKSSAPSVSSCSSTSSLTTTFTFSLSSFFFSSFSSFFSSSSSSVAAFFNGSGESFSRSATAFINEVEPSSKSTESLT